MWPVGQNQKETPTDNGKVAVLKAAQQRGARVKGGPSRTASHDEKEGEDSKDDNIQQRQGAPC